MKGIIVVDEIPKDCSVCAFNKGLNVCKIMKYIKREKFASIHTTDRQISDETKPDWCPIKIPKKIPGEIRYQNEYEKGWNSCIDEILKE